MAFFQLRSVGDSVWPPLPPPEASQVWAAYLELDRTQWLSPDEIQERQLEQLRALLAHCYRESLYYREVMQAAGLSDKPVASLDEFRRVPLLTRELYQKHFHDLQAQRLPAGVVRAGGSFTSGTNGVPIKTLKTSQDGIWWHALFLRDLEWSNIHPRGRLASIRLLAMARDDLPAALAGIRFPHWTHVCQMLVDNGPVFAMDIRQDPRRQLAWLGEMEPDYLVSMPSNLEFLSSLLEESGRRFPRLQAIQSVGEPLSPSARNKIEASFGVPVKNLYSSTEAGYVASPCPAGHGLHVHAENVFTEILDEHDRPCRPGQTGRLVCTALHGYLTPFIRYDIMDEVTLAPGPCPCGRGLPLWQHVEGRRHPLFYLPCGRRKSAMGVVLGVRKVGGFRQFQIVQRRRDHVVIRVVPGHTWQPDNVERLRRVVWDEFETPIRVDIEEKHCLERPAGGKLRVTEIEMEG